MGSSDKFPSGLNKWEEDDLPQRQDFLDDNEIMSGFMDGHAHDAEDIIEGRLSAERLPTSGMANRVLRVGAANGNPGYGPVALGTDVSGTLPVSNGGTGGNTADFGRQGLGIRIYVSTVSVTIAANQTIGSAAITFPSGRFSAAPYVFTGILSGNPEYATSSYAEASVTGATVYAGRSIAASSATTITVRFIAIQGIG